MTSRILREVGEASSTMIRSCRCMLFPPSQLLFAPAAIPGLHAYHSMLPSCAPHQRSPDAPVCSRRLHGVWPGEDTRTLRDRCSDARSMRGFLSTLRQAGKNKPEVGGSADGRGTRVGESIHEQLTKNHDFLVQPTGACAIIGERGENSPCRAGQSRFHWRVLHAPCCSRQGARERRYAGDV